MKYHILIVECEEGGYAAKCAEVPGAHSQGETLAELRENIKDAIRAILESNAEDAFDSEEPNRVEEITVS
jgi:predicted RNase H-like HicB family nuclease